MVENAEFAILEFNEVDGEIFATLNFPAPKDLLCTQKSFIASFQPASAS
jgi:hypothetical protein